MNNNLARIIGWFVLSAIAIVTLFSAFWIIAVLVLALAIVGAVYYVYYRFFRKKGPQAVDPGMIYDVHEEEEKQKEEEKEKKD